LSTANGQPTVSLNCLVGTACLGRGRCAGNKRREEMAVSSALQPHLWHTGECLFSPGTNAGVSGNCNRVAKPTTREHERTRLALVPRRKRAVADVQDHRTRVRPAVDFDDVLRLVVSGTLH